MNSTSHSGFFEFIEGLSNLEKTRNFNVFTGYSLEPFANVLSKYGFDRRNASTLCRISVVGTNAKGSITHFLGEFFRLSGFKTGLYTSPHLISPLERIRIGSQNENFREVEERELDKMLSEWKTEGAESDLKTFSFFELFTLASFFFFEKESVEIQIYEAGLGGRLDATKLCNPDVVVLGSIGFDHKEILGNTKLQILQEKLGICGSDTKSLFAIEPKEPELDEKIREFCSQNGIECFIFSQTPVEGDYLSRNKNFSYQVFQNILNLELFREIDEGNKYEIDLANKRKTELEFHPDFPIKLENRFIKRPFSYYEGRISFPPGRLAVLRDSPLLVFDPAHNPDAFFETLRSLKAAYPKSRFQVLAGILKDKDGNGIVEILRTAKAQSDITDFRILAEAEFSIPANCLPEETLNRSQFQERILSATRTQEPILVLGSFRLFPIVKELLDKNKTDREGKG
ncbi:bifunctional folylpolyglutamate synthase/dihydrofolate synthase [Leptospira sp. FAT2]|uniref:glutamate ligase domain-containing protein n=1 Tax=Leptospira sanjuanensis TaxID=2879643 RepID=UPI001EE8FF1A|nr:cyanophycin synthetase [Leptospira sanjuanensis]MCG6194550.1 bifunctional folylpolyglutamate synthase/dihydrofolate synthase [Leptospira sanjuanensis]